LRVVDDDDDDDDDLCTCVSKLIARAVDCSINMLMRCSKVRASFAPVSAMGVFERGLSAAP
jgi:hypothetical protein